MKTSLSSIQFVLAALIVGCMSLSAGAQEAAATGIETNTTPPWDITADLGFSLTSGNSETLLVRGGVVGKREYSKSRIELGIAGAYGEDTSVANVQTLRGWGQYDQDFAERWYWLGRVELLHDGIADIEYRLTLSPGVGYWFIKKEKTKLSGETGISYVFERRGNRQSDYFALRLAERFEHEFNDRVKLVQNFEILPQIDDFENYFINFDIGLESALNDKLSLTLTFIDNYNNIPAPGRERNDIKFLAGFRYKL
jgi:putative salt-induced outer membrane protein YdiY